MKNTEEKSVKMKNRKLNRMIRKPNFFQIFFWRFLVIGFIATIVVLGFMYVRRYLYRNYRWEQIYRGESPNFTNYSYYQDTINYLNYYVNTRSKNDLLKHYKFNNNSDEFPFSSRRKLFYNLLKEKMIGYIVKEQAEYITLGYASPDFVQNNDINSLILYEEWSDGEVAFEYSDMYVSKLIAQAIKELDNIKKADTVNFYVDDVYLLDNFTFVTDKIYVEYCSNYQPLHKYDKVIETGIQSRELLEKIGYVYVNLEKLHEDEGPKLSPSYYYGMCKVFRARDFGTDIKSKALSADIEMNYYGLESNYAIADEDLKPDDISNVFTMGDTSITVYTRYNYLYDLPVDCNTIWIDKEKYRDPFGYINLEAYTDEKDSIPTNKDILIRDALIIYTLAFFLSILISVITYMRRKNVYDINTYRRELTNIMAHDIKTPLMVLRGNAENLSDIMNSDGELDEENGIKYSSGIIRNVDYMTELVNKTLTLSSLEAGSDKIERKKVSIKTIIEDAKEKCDDILSERGITVDIEGRDLTIPADEYWLREAFKNLIDNASKYADENTKVEISLNKKCITFTNMASDVTEEDLKRLANPFVKKDESRGGRKGSGLGLSIVKNIIELHGWKMTTRLQDKKFVIEIKL